MIKTATLTRDKNQLRNRLSRYKKQPKEEIVYDDDSPELTPAMEKAFRLAAKNRNTHKNTAIS